MKIITLTVLLSILYAAADDSFISGARQLTLSGKRSGEGYFSADGQRMIFQSEREPDNPFYQIYLLDFGTGDVRRLSPGHGKTTCAWLHPDGRNFLFASTHEDLGALDKQKSELTERANGKQKRYAWDYDENYDLFTGDLNGGPLTNLTHTRGYDAEGCLSPDGKWIAFASNRHAYTEPLDGDIATKFADRKSLLMDIYHMKTDGTDVKRLTTSMGYDGGVFFSPDGRRLCWRRFNEDETQAEIWTMNVDGTDQKQLTHMGAMSWAPYYHPSGSYLIFTTNKQGFDNFELYLVDAVGTHEPVRVTTTEGFDGLPVFHPHGGKLSWTSNRTADKSSQIYLADWDHAGALKSLGLGAPVTSVPAIDITSLQSAITAADMKQHVQYLASDALQGRLTGSEGERLATDYVAAHFKEFGLEAAGKDGSWLHHFAFTAGVDLGKGNTLTLTGTDFTPAVQRDWTPITFSTIGEIAEAGIVFAGYGLEVPEGVDESGKKHDAYSSYYHLDVKDHWVMMLRYVPEGLSQEERIRFARFSSLRHKALTARQKGARGIIVVSGPNAKVVQQLVPLSFDASMAGSGLAAISITDDMAAALLRSSDKSLAALQEKLDTNEQMQGFSLPGLKLAATLDIHQEKRTGHNVLGRIRAPGGSSEPPLIIGAHIDHLGADFKSDSRATEKSGDTIHHGADDNASGVAGVMEIAQSMAAAVREGTLELKRDVIFAGWSGEETGLLGSNAWCRDLASATGNENAKLTSQICANLNMDMIGRMRKSLLLQGLGSSAWWTGEIEKLNAVLGLPIQTQQDCYLPTDAATFYLRGVPILNAFTGAHEDYHKPSDTADKVNYEKAAAISEFMMRVARTLATRSEEPIWRELKKPEEGSRGGMRVYLGTVPDYSQEGIEGVKLSGVSAIGPAAKAGLLAGDIIVKLAGKDIQNIYDYTFVMSVLKIGQTAEIEVLRNKERVKLNITPGSRE